MMKLAHSATVHITAEATKMLKKSNEARETESVTKGETKQKYI